MITLDIKQGSPEWHFARLGIPTASQFGRIVSTSTRKPLAGAKTYMHELLAEWLIGIPNSVEARGYMERGNNMEQWAVTYYELQRNVTTVKAGVCMRDDKLVACSPDRLVGSDGGLEIKCPSASKHVANMLEMGDEYFAQVQGNMWITGRQWWDLVSYHPEIPPVILRIERDEEYIGALSVAMTKFLSDLLHARALLVAQGATPAPALNADFAASLVFDDEPEPAAVAAAMASAP